MAARSEEMLARVTPELRAEIELAAEEERRRPASSAMHSLNGHPSASVTASRPHRQVA
jgi:hypothetical protein